MNIRAHIKTICCVILVGWSSIHGSTHTNDTNKLNSYRYGGAGVLPLVIDQNNNKYILVSREKGGPHKGTYDVWGGKRDSGEKPTRTASREFTEESMGIGADIVTYTKGDKKGRIDKEKTAQKVQDDWVSLSKNHTKAVIARKNYVIFLTRMRQRYVYDIMKHFYNKNQYYHREKDSIALIEYNSFIDSLAHQKTKQPLFVKAYVVKPQKKKNHGNISQLPARLQQCITSNSLYIDTKNIQLRSIIPSVLKEYAQDKVNKTSALKNNRIHIYS
jgi:predicted NUDIX family NTP pyrophosphohydrolase